MSFLAPGFLFASLAVAAAIVALHFIVTRQPRSAILPTARFVPDTRATAVARAKRPSDLLLMLLRVLAVVAAGAALAKPVLERSRAPDARVILVDLSRSARDSIAIRDSVRAIYRDGDAVVLFDSAARVIGGNVGDTLGALRPTTRRGNLSAALIAALRAGSALRDRAESFELVIVSPLAKEELDAATDSIRALWLGKAKLVRIGGSVVDTLPMTGRLEISADAGDPLQATVALARSAGAASGVVDRRDFRGVPARSVSESSSRGGETRIAWPASARPPGAVQRAVTDTVGGVMAGESVVVAAFERRWSYPADSVGGAEVIARWVDGEPAAIERPDGDACVRSVAIAVTPVGDLAIRRDFVRFVASLSGPCVATTSLMPADPSSVAKLQGIGGLTSREAFQPLSDVRSELAPWLLALALAAVIAELFVRRRRRDVLHAGNRPESHKARAA
ncbi:MAG: BatA domain-containing protein [Gemmatimonadaceae bacterium]